MAVVRVKNAGGAMKKQAQLFLGLDSSTQGLKAVAIDAALGVKAEASVVYDTDLPAYQTSGGVHRHPGGLAVTAPPQMWAEALELLFMRMAADKFPFGAVVAVSGSGQQHGSVYLKKGARHLLRKLDPARPLAEQVKGLFSVDASPVWMDSSTTRECQNLEKALGGPQKVADLTGSRAYERFTGNQIAKIAKTRRAGYTKTERIALVSSYVASLIAGDYAPIDVSDGSGMNLMDIRARDWAPRALAACAPRLKTKLGPLAPSHAAIGKVGKYCAKRYGFAPECLVIAFSGDNPNSVAGLRLEKSGDIAISLGTSDTMFASLSEPRPSATEGHIFASPVDPAGYMALLCYKNGSLTREFIRDHFAGGTWEQFNSLLASNQPGNNGRIGFYYREPEITPPVLKPGFRRFDVCGNPVSHFNPPEEVRAVVEGQFLSMLLHGANIGIKPVRILATGGASKNEAIIRIMADVFGVPVFTGEIANSAALGAAYRALHGWLCSGKGSFVPFAKAVKGPSQFKQAAVPDKDAHAIYSGMLARYAGLEKRIA